MTLIAAGYENQRRLFFAADSTISNGITTVLGGFQKVYEIPVQTSEPLFMGERFHRYGAARQRTTCTVAFAGNTLTSQHVLNIITKHLANLMIGQDRGGQYATLRFDEYNEILRQNRDQAWDENMFTAEDMRDILTGDRILEIIQHAIGSAIDSARKYKLDEMGVRSLKNEYAIGIYCPRDETVSLAVIRTDVQSDGSGILQPQLTTTKVNQNTVAVLGMKNRFSVDGDAAYRAASAEGNSTGRAMFSFVQESISKVQSEGSSEIDLPAYWYDFGASGLMLAGIASAAGKSAA